MVGEYTESSGTIHAMRLTQVGLSDKEIEAKVTELVKGDA